MNSPLDKDDASRSREEQVGAVVAGVLYDRMSGEGRSDEEIVAEFPQLMPELGDALRKLQLVADAAEQCEEEQWLQAMERMEAEPAAGDTANGQAGNSQDSPDASASSPSAPSPPTEMIGRYRVLGVIDEGGQAVVYRAVHPTLPDLQLAIKLSRQPVKVEGGIRSRLADEGRLLSRLDHPTLARVHDMGIFEGRVFVAVDLIRGHTLEQHVEAQPLPPAEAAALIAKVARGVAYAHRLGITHQDIKPRNIVVDQQGEPHLIDFGMGLLRFSPEGEPPRPNQISGTAAYMAPEQARGEVNPQNDVFALGAVLYALLARRAPFAALTSGESLQRARRCDFDRAALRRPDIPRGLRDVCLKAMDADPAKRYANADELAEDLTRRAQRPRWARRSAMVVLAAAVLAGIAFWPRGAPPPAPPSVPQPGAGRDLTVKLTGTVWHPKNSRSRDPEVYALPDALPLRTGDKINLELQSSRPAYIYLIWIDTEGVAYPLYPWSHWKWEDFPSKETPIDELEWPAPNNFNPIKGPAGMEAFVVLARETPLPADLRLSKLFEGLPKQEDHSGRSLLWFEQGKVVLKTGGHDRGPALTGPEPLPGLADSSTLQTQRSLYKRLAAYFVRVSAVCVRNQGK